MRYLAVAGFLLAAGATLILSSRLFDAATHAQTTPHLVAAPLLVLHPTTVSQAARVEGVDLAMQVRPLLPGSTQVRLWLRQNGQEVRGARIQLVSTMAEMRMPPVVAPARTAGQVYLAHVDLSMLGHWWVEVRAAIRGRLLTHRFLVNLPLPAGLLSALEYGRASTPAVSAPPVRMEPHR